MIPNAIFTEDLAWKKKYGRLEDDYMNFGSMKCSAPMSLSKSFAVLFSALFVTSYFMLDSSRNNHQSEKNNNFLDMHLQRNQEDVKKHIRNTIPMSIPIDPQNIARVSVDAALLKNKKL